MFGFIYRQHDERVKRGIGNCFKNGTILAVFIDRLKLAKEKG